MVRIPWTIHVYVNVALISRRITTRSKKRNGHDMLLHKVRTLKQLASCGVLLALRMLHIPRSIDGGFCLCVSVLALGYFIIVVFASFHTVT